MSRDKILHDSWNISTALARGFSDCHFERGEGPEDEVAILGVLLIIGTKPELKGQMGSSRDNLAFWDDTDL